MSETNKDLVRRLYAGLMARGDTAVADEVVSAAYVDHDLPGIGEGGKKDLIGAVQAVRASIPDISPSLGPILAEGELVAVRVEAGGSHTGVPFPPGVPASGARVTWKEMHVFRCQGGQIVEHWGVFDMLGILQQLGAIPVPT
jgi:predicted ester cyclase